MNFTMYNWLSCQSGKWQDSMDTKNFLLLNILKYVAWRMFAGARSLPYLNPILFETGKEKRPKCTLSQFSLFNHKSGIARISLS